MYQVAVFSRNSEILYDLCASVSQHDKIFALPMLQISSFYQHIQSGKISALVIHVEEINVAERRRISSIIKMLPNLPILILSQGSPKMANLPVQGTQIAFLDLKHERSDVPHLLLKMIYGYPMKTRARNRKKSKFWVSLNFGSYQCQAFVLNLSAGGIAVKFSDKDLFLKEQKGKISLHSLDQNEHHVMEAELVWRDQQRQIAGLKFIK